MSDDQTPSYGPYRWANAEQTMIHDERTNRFVPPISGNRYYDGILEYGHEILPCKEAQHELEISPAPSGVFDSEEPDGEFTDGIAGPDSMVYEGSPLETSEPAYDEPSGAMGEAEDVSYPDDPDPSDAVDEPDPAQLGGVLIQEGTHTETILMNLRETPLRLVRDYYESRLTDEIGDENARQALHFAGTEDEFRDEKLAWVAAMDATLQEKLQAIQDETDPMALVNYRSEAEGWPAPSVEVIEYEDEQDED